MNDEFLHRIRKTPPPEFLAGLKARLDRQSPAPAPAPAPRRRWSFTRGLITGLLLGGAAFALTAVSLTRGPESLRSLVRTPADYFARLMRGSGRADDQAQANSQHKAVPLGPAWLPGHAAAEPSGQDPTAPAESTAVAVKEDGHSGPVNSAAQATGSAHPGGGAFPALDNINVVASFDAYPHALASAAAVTRYGFHMTVGIDSGNALDRLCSLDSPTPVDVVELSRRITADELRHCNRNAFTKLVEVKVGYQAIVLARAQLYGPLRLTARDLFLALARRIPDPARPGKFISNPNTTWNQVNSSLPYDRIQVTGPSADSSTGKLIAHLLLHAGCNSYPWIAAIQDSDPDGYESICATLRNDGAYAPSNNPSGWAYSDELVTNPTALGIFRLNDLNLSRNSLLLSPVDSVVPRTTDLAAGTYPLAEPIYLYTNKFRGNQRFMAVVRASLTPRFPYSGEGDFWPFVPLDTAESIASLANAMALKELQF